MDENQRLHVISNRLGGQDLRVFRDNFEAVTQGMLNDNGKRPSTEGGKADRPSSTASYAKTKRARAKQRLDEIQSEIDEAESKHSPAGGETMRMLLLFQKDSDRRAEAEERRRRAERDERLATKKKRAG